MFTCTALYAVAFSPSEGVYLMEMRITYIYIGVFATRNIDLWNIYRYVDKTYKQFFVHEFQH